MKKRTFVCILLTLTLVLCSAGVCFAAIEGMQIGTTRNSNTSGTVRAKVAFNQDVSTCSMKILLQEKYDGKWRTATGVPKTSVSISKKQVDALSCTTIFTLKKGKVYRAHVTVKHKIGSTTYTNAYGSNTF